MGGPTTPHLVVNSHMLHFCWQPADPETAPAPRPEGPASSPAIREYAGMTSGWPE